MLQRCGACGLQGNDSFLTDHATAIGHEHAAEFRIGRHFPPLPVVCHVGRFPLRSGKGHGLTALVELKRHADRRALCAIAMKMRDNGLTAIHLDQADPPRRTFAKIDVARHACRRLREEFTPARRIDEAQASRQTGRAGFACWIGKGAAIVAALQHEAAFGRRSREPVRRPAARSRRRGRQARSQQRVLAPGRLDRVYHREGPARIAAPEARPRS